MGDFGHLIIITQNPPWHYHWLGVIQVVLHVVLNLVLHLVMVKVVWFLEPHKFNSIKMIVGVMVEIFCNLRVGIIQIWVIPTNIGPIILNIWGGMINLVLMVMAEAVLVLVTPIYTPRQLVFAETVIIGGFSYISVIKQHPIWCYLGLCII